MSEFYVADLNALGELHQLTPYDYASLELVPGALDVIARCSAELWKNPAEFEIPLMDGGQCFLRWRSTSESSGIATVRRKEGDLVSLSLLAAGRDPQAEATNFDVLQKHILRELRQTPFEPAFDLIGIKQRPLIATMTFATTGSANEQLIEALADRCFAAAYFRYLGLA
jgi:hypothetical protein